MKTTGNTILITGGGSGIGRGLAEAFHSLGNKVIIAGRRKDVLDQTTSANPGMASFSLDIDDPAAILAFAKKIVAEHPALNVLINNSGIMRLEDLVNHPRRPVGARSHYYHKPAGSDSSDLGPAAHISPGRATRSS